MPLALAQKGPSSPATEYSARTVSVVALCCAKLGSRVPSSGPKGPSITFPRMFCEFGFCRVTAERGSEPFVSCGGGAGRVVGSIPRPSFTKAAGASWVSLPEVKREQDHLPSPPITVVPKSELAQLAVERERSMLRTVSLQHACFSGVSRNNVHTDSHVQNVR